MNLREDVNRIKEVMEQTSLELKGRTIAPKYTPPDNFGKSNPKEFNLDNDDIVDVISAAIDGVPGVGNLVSFGIDQVHAISYLIRASVTTDNKRIENIILAIMTSAIAFLPMAGNIVNLTSRQGIKTILRQTPDSIQAWAIKNGIINSRILLQKGVFKYSILILILKIFGDEGVESFAANNEKIKQSFISAKSIINKKGLSNDELNQVFNTVISKLDGYNDEEIAVAKQMIDKGLL